jgi:hypothetical protein
VPHDLQAENDMDAEHLPMDFAPRTAVLLVVVSEGEICLPPEQLLFEGRPGHVCELDVKG